MRVLILHNEVTANASLEDQDTLLQVDAVRTALKQSGQEVDVLPITLDFERLRGELGRRSPDVVFNLVESLLGTDRLISLVPLILESLRIPYTGNRATAIYLSSDKVLGKERLRAAGLPTPDWWEFPPGRRCLAQSSRFPGDATELEGALAIVKSVDDHGSVGMHDDCLVPLTADGLTSEHHLTHHSRELGKRLFAERYIDGREINVSLLGRPGHASPCVLPPAEILFVDYPPDKPRLVGYNAKWAEGSFEYQNTPRTFEFAPEDRKLLDEVVHLARECWELFGLRGYARVDFRIDRSGRPWILEVNANPCLTPEGGYWAALEQAQIEYAQAIQAIVEDALG